MKAHKHNFIQKSEKFYQCEKCGRSRYFAKKKWSNEYEEWISGDGSRDKEYSDQMSLSEVVKKNKSSKASLWKYFLEHEQENEKF